MRQPLIYDVGMHDGSDSEYYLRLGYRVIAIEANPELAARVQGRLRSHINSGDLIILNVGIASQEGKLPFYIRTNTGHSSFEPPKNGTATKTVSVPCATFRSIVDCHGIPYYCKIDIEGKDYLCIEAFSPDTKPTFLSTEFLRKDYEGALERLVSLGYRRFKLISQAYHNCGEPIYRRDYGWRALRKLDSIVPGIVLSLPDAWKGNKEDLLRRHPRQSPSGPFGDEAHGPWKTAREILSMSRRIETHFLEISNPDPWYDLHAAE